MDEERKVEGRKRTKAARREATEREASAVRESERVPEPTSPRSSGALLTLVALLAGVAVGWFVRGGTVKPEPDRAVRAVASAGKAGACDGWSSEVCKRLGKTSEGCKQAQGAASMLPEEACTAARGDLDNTVTKLKAARAACDTLVQKLCTDLGEETPTCKMVREKTPLFPTEQCKGMLENYDDVLTELRSEDAENAPISPDLAQRQAAGDGPGFGPKDAKLTLVLYSDFECPFCSRAADAIHKIKEKYGTKVRFVFRQFPLPMHEHADLAAQAALAAHAQGKFWAFHDLLFQNQRDLERPSLEKYAQKAGLDMAKFKKALDDRTYEGAVKADMKMGSEAHVSGTPSMFLGTERVENAIEADAIAQQIDQKLAGSELEPSAQRRETGPHPPSPLSLPGRGGGRPEAPWKCSRSLLFSPSSRQGEGAGGVRSPLEPFRGALVLLQASALAPGEVDREGPVEAWIRLARGGASVAEGVVQRDAMSLEVRPRKDRVASETMARPWCGWASRAAGGRHRCKVREACRASVRCSAGCSRSG